METLGNNFPGISGKKDQNDYVCEKCDYSCNKKSHWSRHLLTAKHSKISNGNSPEIKKGQTGKKGQDTIFACENCDKIFQTSAGLWKHNKSNHNSNLSDEIVKKIMDKDELIMFLIKENSEFKNIILEQQNMMMKVLENGTNSVTHNTNTNCMTNSNNNNKAFNLNFFLNETCKDAMNITDFVDSIKLQLSDLEKFGEVGYVEGISNIITTNLKALDVTQRPVHCTDKKRETMYIKDENHWEKEDENKTRLRKAIKHIANKNIRLLPLFREKYPDYKNSSSRTSDKYDKMVVEAMGGAGNNDIEKEDKIIRNISNITTIEKLQNNNIK